MDIFALPSTTDDAILDHLSPAELYKYARTCSAVHQTVAAYIRRKFQLGALLGRYFSTAEILEFRCLQFNTGMLISGSTALQFFNRTVYEDADLDLYVEHRLRKPIAIWLAHIGYKYAPHHKPEFPTLDGALSVTDSELGNTGVNVSSNERPEYREAVMVLTFEKHAPYRKVQVITSRSNPISNVLRFHSTCVMNIITHNMAYSFFPRATFEDRRRSLKVTPRGFETTTLKPLAKYKARGWEIVDQITRDDFDGPNAVFSHGPRRVGDARCWTMRILPDIGLPDGFIESNAWETQYTVNLVANMRFYSVYSRTHLRAGYIIPPDTRLVDWIKEITKEAIAQWVPRMDRYANI
ncbi:hypothetical protein HYPSUDRAFT_42508 [Hypholoma sublateritium FD-334 SS-4]|uniref:Uncharacterized protein n=1 Tax=Hypholoma sublateritium (strain FD-334 SS-4) TaxID=945553 RepID=A0A0D2PLY3_HYPSF|nr:hypothetical protein HYPSUDRAFT_42508 [Hypholoma sublateritium FD-334 SS-4]